MALRWQNSVTTEREPEAPGGGRPCPRSHRPCYRLDSPLRLGQSCWRRWNPRLSFPTALGWGWGNCLAFPVWAGPEWGDFPWPSLLSGNNPDRGAWPLSSPGCSEGQRLGAGLLCSRLSLPHCLCVLFLSPPHSNPSLCILGSPSERIQRKSQALGSPKAVTPEDHFRLLSLSFLLC